MTSFAQRMGLRPVRSLVQRDSLDEETRTELWNLTLNLSQALGQEYGFEGVSVLDNVTGAIWAWEFKKPRDEQPSHSHVVGMVKSQILSADWADALDLIEAIVGYAKRFETYNSEDVLPLFIPGFNEAFEKYLVAFRFVNLKLVPLDSEVELESVNAALKGTQPFKGARHHLEQAASLLSDRRKPDYPNSIKESISAVESICRFVTGQNTLGAALTKLEGAGVKIDPALQVAWSKMYGWTSNADGIRHGSIDAPDADQALAKYMLVTCSAFVSLIIEVGRKAGLI